MKLNDLLVFSLRNLSRRKLRTILTLLSILIGTSFIILMISFGLGMQKSNEEMIESMGGLTNITVRSNDYFRPEMENDNKSKVLNDSKVKSFTAMEGVKDVLPVIEINSASILIKNYDAYATIKGVDVNKMEEFGYTIEEGSNITQNSDDEYVFSNIHVYNSLSLIHI